MAKNTAADRAAQAARVLSRSEPEEKPQAPSRAPLSKPVRVSADLPPKTYKQLQEFCQDAAVDLGVPRVAHVKVLRALLQELAEHEDLRKRVCQRIWANDQ